VTKRQMAKKIKDLEQRIEDLEKELQCATGRILPMDVGAARLRPPMIIAVGTAGPPKLYRRYSRRTDGLPESMSGVADAPFEFPRYTAGGSL